MHERPEGQAHAAGSTAARRRSPGPAETEQGRLLALQRSAGNRATAAAVAGGLLQRRMDFDPAFLGASSFKEKAAAAFGGENLWRQIKDALIEYRATPQAERQLALLKTMLALIIKWMDGNKKARSSGGGRAFTLGQLGEAIHKEMANAERQAGYMADVASEESAMMGGQPRGSKFKYLSSTASSAISSAQAVAGGGGGKAERAQAELMKQYDLTDAELAAIKIYTVDDYKYINPAMAGNEAWMAAQIPKVAGATSKDASPAGVKEAMKEGKRHGEMAMEGLRKLPAWKGNTFRGLRLTPAELKKQYQDTIRYDNKAFLSTSTEADVSNGFAKKTEDDGKVGILLHYEVTNGRDVAKYSLVGSEKEVLLLPGAAFAIVDVQERPGRPADDKMYDVTLKQVS
jgi:hypothetical protein